MSPLPLASPDPLGKRPMSPFATPSCWGTPDFLQGSRAGTIAEAPSDMGPLMQAVWMPQMQWQCDGFMGLANSVSLPPPPDPRSELASTTLPETQVADPPMLRLRGLPFDTTSNDVLAFFAQHGVADRIADGINAVQIMSKSTGKPSGNAIVQLRNADDVGIVHKTLHKEIMGSRYIEVLAHPPAATGSGPQPPKSKREQDSAEHAVLQSAPFQAMVGPTMYSDTMLLSHLAVSMAQCSTEQDFFGALNTGFKALPRADCGTPWFECSV